MDHLFYYCSHCGKKLRGFTAKLDWNKRMLHKSCWKKNQDELSMKMMIEDIQKMQKK